MASSFYQPQQEFEHFSVCDVQLFRSKWWNESGGAADRRIRPERSRKEDYCQKEKWKANTLGLVSFCIGCVSFCISFVYHFVSFGTGVYQLCIILYRLWVSFCICSVSFCTGCVSFCVSFVSFCIGCNIWNRCVSIVYQLCIILYRLCVSFCIGCEHHFVSVLYDFELDVYYFA